MNYVNFPAQAVEKMSFLSAGERGVCDGQKGNFCDVKDSFSLKLPITNTSPSCSRLHTTPIPSRQITQLRDDRKVIKSISK